MNIKGIEVSGFIEAKGGEASKVARLVASKGVFSKGVIGLGEGDLTIRGVIVQFIFIYFYKAKAIDFSRLIYISLL